MAFGFVVVKFSLFVKHLSLAFGRKIDSPSHGYSAIIAIVLMARGVLSILFSFWQYRKTDQQLRSGTYQPSTVLTSILRGVILLISMVLIVYLIQIVI